MSEEMAKKRFKLMRRLYELTAGEEGQAVHFNKMQEQLGFSTSLLQDIIFYLENEKLITFQSPGNMINITPAGAAEIEAVLMAPDKATVHFPARDNTAAKQNMEMQMQDSYDKSQSFTIGESRYNELQELLQVLSASLDQLNLSFEQKARLQSELGIITSQMLSSKPKATIIPGSVVTIKRILESAARTPFEYEVLNKITQLIG
ncbi:MAG: hypothetical protein HY920_03715 [Elusimicrobia bacterium]|nr:hypothetical protein [Elusimicrobiota bacterium]